MFPENRQDGATSPRLPPVESVEAYNQPVRVAPDAHTSYDQVGPWRRPHRWIDGVRNFQAWHVFHISANARRQDQTEWTVLPANRRLGNLCKNHPTENIAR